MRNKFILPFVFGLIIANITYAQIIPEKGLNQITSDYLKTQIDYLASDSLKGRNTPSPELDIAANYIANELSKFGVKKVNGSYFQTIPLCTKDLNIDGCNFSISKNNNSLNFTLKKDYTPFEVTSNGNVNAAIVFAGYGITAPEYNYDDYQNIDVLGKIVLVMKHEPREMDSCDVFEGKADSKHASISSKLKNAMDHGASAIMIVTDPLNHLSITPQGYSWASLSRFKPRGGLPIEINKQEESIPCIQVGENVITTLFGSVDSLKNIQKQIDFTLTPNSFAFQNTSGNVKTELNITQYAAKNVVGIIKGTDTKLKDEIIVIGAHYDHVGYKEYHKPNEDYIFNGADDNASGTAGVMNLAKAFSKIKKSKRSILFILFAGEEKGLYGSYYYTEHPLLPLNNTVAMLNMDMISRNGDSLQIPGNKFNPELTTIIKEENEHIGLNITEAGNEYFGASDHINFFKNDISSVFFFSGTHKDYHTVRDNPDTVDFIKAEKVAKLVFRTAWRIANENKHYSINKN
ncbi:MAG: M28 family peptidase [Bacteroidales bacterium]